VLKGLLEWIPSGLRDIVFILFGIGYFIWAAVDIYKVITKKKNKIVQIIIADVISLITFCILIYLAIVPYFNNKIKLMIVSYLFIIAIIFKSKFSKNEV
jgi:hypothetical protein